MKIRANDRVLFAGKTGSGKTWLAEKLTASLDRLIIIDPQDSLESWGVREGREPDWKKLEKGKTARFRIIPPVTDDPFTFYESLFERIYNLGRVTVYIDELYSVVPPQSKFPKWLNALYTRGRKLGIGVWAATQRPAYIPLFTISESEWIIMFRVSLAEDRKRLAAVAGDELLQPIKDEHGFWLYGVRNEKPIYYRTAVLNSKKGV